MLEKYPYRVAVYEKKTYSHQSRLTLLCSATCTCPSAVGCMPGIKKNQDLYCLWATNHLQKVCSQALLYCQYDGLCLPPAILFVPAFPPMWPHCVANPGPGFDSGGAKLVWWLFDSPGLPQAKAKSHRGAEALWKADKHYLPTQQETGHPWKWRKTARSTTITGQNLCLFEIHLSELLSLRSLQGTWTLPSLSGFGVREDSKSSSLYHREIFIFFFLSFLFYFILFLSLIYLMLPHSMVVSP